MLIIGSIIILGVYAGSRLRDRYKNKQKNITKTSSLKILDNPKKQQHYVNTSSVAIILSTLSYVYPPLRITSFALITYNTLPILRRAEHSLIEQHKLKNDTLSAFVNIISLGMGLQLAAAIQSYVYHLGCKMTASSKDLSTEVLSHVFIQQPTQVWVLREQIEVQIKIEDLQRRDIIAIKTGEMIPVDGVVIKGDASVDQQTLTGESIPVEKHLGDEVFAATLIISGDIYIKVEKTGIETTASQLEEILRKTANFKTQLQLKGEYWANASTIPLMAGSFLSIPFIGLNSAVTALFSAPTNTIQVMTSMQTLNYMTLIASHSILIKDGRALESLGKIDVVLFDKTGTLTEEYPKITAIHSFTQLSENQLLSYAAAAEMRLTHPVAQTIVKEAEKRGLKCPQVDQAYYKMGHGIAVEIEGLLIQVGSSRFMKKEGIEIPDSTNPAAIFIAVNGIAEGCIELEANIREEIPETLALLRQQGIKEIIIVSGDHQQPTQDLAERLGIDDYFHDVLPQDKANIVKQLQQQGHRVCFIGDGINDTLAMQQADVSISLAGAASIATDMAQVVFMDGDLVHLNKLFELAKQLNTSIESSLLFWASYGVGNIALAAFYPIGLIKSSILFGGVFTLGLSHAILPLIRLAEKDAEKIKSLPHNSEGCDL